MKQRVSNVAIWLLGAAVPMLLLGLLASTIANRLLYPYDLEWMEGGLLHHAQRIADGQGIYPEPSVNFIPYLYTPLYPALVAMLGNVFGISYVLGRAISVFALLAMFGTAYATLRATSDTHSRGPALARLQSLLGASVALGIFAAGYPLMEGWYDLVRADTLFLAMITVGIWLAARMATVWWRAGLVGGFVALAFFTKQTGILYVAWGGVLIAVIAFAHAFAQRATRSRWLLHAVLPPLTYAASAGLLGLGGVALLNRATGRRFWMYIYEIHQAHDFNMDRFWKSFDVILTTSKGVTVVIAVATLGVVVTAVGKRHVPPAAKPFLLWLPTFAISTVVGAVGWGTEFAHYNAFMPAFLHAGFAAVTGIVALAACTARWFDAGERHTTGAWRQWLPLVVTALGLAAISQALWHHRWKPKRYSPTLDDWAAGAALIAKIQNVDGEVWVPFHPWYAKLAGKNPYVHRMGIKDMTWRKPRMVHGLGESIAEARFAAIVFDNRAVMQEQPQMRVAYRPAFKLPATMRPRVFTGASVVPDSWWVPARDAAVYPEGSKVVFDFEDQAAHFSDWGAWQRSGAAWGNGPVTLGMSRFEVLYGYQGAKFATSYGSGDGATGRITSPPFVIEGQTLQLLLSGGDDKTKLRVELVIDGNVVAVVGAASPPAEIMKPVTIDVAAYQGQTASLVLVDEATGSYGHLSVDDVLLLP